MNDILTTIPLLYLISVLVILLLIGLILISLFLKRRRKKKIAVPKTTQKEYLEQTELLKLATEALPAGIWDFYPAEGTGYLNEKWCFMFGYNPEHKEITMDEWKNFIHPQDLPFSEKMFTDYIHSGGQGQFETKFRIRKADNSWCWVLAKGRAIAWDENGNPTRVIGLHLNIQNNVLTEQTIALSERRFRAIFEYAPYPIVINSFEDGRYLEANKAFLDSREISKEDLLRLRSSDFATISDKEVANVLDTLMRNGSLRNREATVTKKDGTVGHINYSSVLMEIEGQKQILSMTVDMTEQKRAQEALKESEARFRALFMNAPIPLLNATLDGKITEINDRFTRVLGYTIEEIPDLDHWWETAYPEHEYRNRVKSIWEKAVGQAIENNSGVEPEEYRVTCKDGAALTMIIGANVIGGTILVSFFDISEHREKERALEESMELLRATFNATTDGILVVNNKLKITQANRQFYRMWHIPPDLQGTDDDATLRKFVQGQLTDPAGFQEMVDKLYHSQIHDMREIPFKNGRVFECNSAPMVMGGKEIGRVWNFRDITKRKQAEKEREKLQEQLLQAQKLEAVGILAGGVAHDFNNMLGAIIGYAELTIFDMDPADPLCKNLESILDAAMRSGDLTRQLLAFARKQAIEPVVFDLNKSIEAILKMIRRLIGENIELAWLPGTGPCIVRMDTSQFDQILVNLCVNARDAITDVGRITIETDTVYFDTPYCASHVEFVPGNYVLLAVSDDGCGMDKDTLNHIFEPFFTTKGLGQGTGMGLPTVYGIVKQNNGFINVYSEPGNGTTFKIYIPLNTLEPVALNPKHAEVNHRSRGETILIVEDNPTLLEMGMMMLKKLGYSVISAGTPSEAIRIVAENITEIHLVITDVVMPEMNGRELADRIQGIRPKIKHLFMSGYTANVIAHQGVLNEGVNFIQKPFTLKDMAAKLRTILD